MGPVRSRAGPRLRLSPFRVHADRYVGNERNVVVEDWDAARVRFLLCYPDGYEVGMSHTGTPIPYHIVNRDPHELEAAAARLLAVASVVVRRERNGTSRAVDVRPLTHDLTVSGPNELRVGVATPSDGSAKPTEVMQALLALAPEDVLRLHIHEVRASGPSGEPPDTRAIARAEVLTLETGNPDQWELAGNARGHSGGRAPC